VTGARRTIRLWTRGLSRETRFAQFLVLSHSNFDKWALLDAIFIIFTALALLLRRPFLIFVKGVSVNPCDRVLLFGFEERVELRILVGSLYSQTRNSRHVGSIEILDDSEVKVFCP
jgi:hypothetical protein